MLFCIFLVLSLLLTAVYVFAFCGGVFMLGRCLGVLVLSYVLCHVVYLGGVALLTAGIDTKKPIEKANKLCKDCIANLSALVLLYFGVRLHTEGLEKLPKERFLMICNHRGAFDPLSMMAGLRDYEISCVSKPSNMKIPVLGRVAYGAGYMPIDRKNDRNALKTILQAADYLKRGVCSICIYPEGTRSRSGELLPFHAGSFKIAQRGGAPLVIACIKDSERVFKNFPLRPTNIRLEILEVLPAERVKGMSTAELSDYSRSLIEKKLAEAAS